MAKRWLRAQPQGKLREEAESRGWWDRQACLGMVGTDRGHRNCRAHGPGWDHHPRGPAILPWTPNIPVLSFLGALYILNRWYMRKHSLCPGLMS